MSAWRRSCTRWLPQAQLYLAEARTAVDLQAAEDYLDAQGVSIITRSETAEFDGPGNGTGPIATIINNAVADGIAMVQLCQATMPPSPWSRDRLLLARALVEPGWRPMAELLRRG